MALTRPLVNNLSTNIEVFNESMTVLNAGASSPNVDVGFIFNRAHGLVANTAMYWSESLQSFVYAFTNNAGVTASNISISNYANVQLGNVLFVNGAGLYINGTLGSPGSVLGSNGTSLAWVAGGGFTGGTITNQLIVSNTTATTSTTTGALQVAGGAGIAGNLYVGGNVQVAGAFIGNVTLGTVPSSPNNLYTVAPLNLINSQSATLKTQLNLINTGGSGGAGSAIDFYTYTGVGNGIPGARFGAIDDNNYGATFQWFIKADGNNGNNNLQSVLSVNQLGNVVIPGTTTSSSTTTGALVVAGGAGVAGNLNVGGNITRGTSAVTDIANTITSVGTGATAIDTFANTTIRVAKYIISAQDTITSQSQAAEVLLAQDGANVNVVTYGIIYTGTSQRMTFSANMSAGTITLWATGTSSNNTVKLSRTAIPM